MTAESNPDYLSTPAAAQACTVLHRAAQESLTAVAGKPVAVTLEGRRPVSADEVAASAKNVLIELQFERPAEVHHSILALADAATLTALFALPAPEDETEILSAEALLSLGDIVSTFLDTLGAELTWLQPTPRAWLANLEPIAGEAGEARIELPALLASDTPLYLAALSLDAGAEAQCDIEVVFGAQTEQVLLGLAEIAGADDAAQAAPSAGPVMPDPPGVSAPPAPAATPPAMASSVPTETAPAAPTRAAAPVAPVQAAQFKPLGPDQTVGRGHSIDLIRDVPLHISVELGRASLTVREILALGAGSVVELDRLAGEPVDVLVNDRLIAHGEVVIVDESFGVRITEILREGGRKAAV